MAKPWLICVAVVILNFKLIPVEDQGLYIK
jgi:hypothetical protein